jgi:Zn-dependent protease with chaperone function
MVRIGILIAGLALLGTQLLSDWYPASGQEAGRESARSTASDSARYQQRDGSESIPVQVPQPSELAMRYYRSGMRLWAFDICWAVIVPAVIAFSGFSARLRDLARKLGRWWFPTVGIFVVLYLGLVFLIDLPLAYYQGFVRQHAYGLSNQTPLKWMNDSLIRLGVEMIVGFCFAWVPYLLLARLPRLWWLITALLSVPFLFAAVLVKPIWIDPLMNQYGPMKDKRLERSILDLASRAGIEGGRVFEVNKSVDTKAVNAYVTGLLGTKRIVLWDTLIARLDENELLVVMGHEMGHYVLGHVVRSILLSSLVTVLSLYLVDRAGRLIVSRYSQGLRFDTLADVASVPLLLLLVHLTSLFLSPVVFAYSRYQEHEADRFALDLTHANHSGGMAFVKLQRENLSNPRPGWIYRVFRATHPSIGERIDFFNAYHSEREGDSQPSTVVRARSSGEAATSLPAREAAPVAGNRRKNASPEDKIGR